MLDLLFRMPPCKFRRFLGGRHLTLRPPAVGLVDLFQDGGISMNALGNCASASVWTACLLEDRCTSLFVVSSRVAWRRSLAWRQHTPARSDRTLATNRVTVSTPSAVFQHGGGTNESCLIQNRICLATVCHTSALAWETSEKDALL